LIDTLNITNPAYTPNYEILAVIPLAKALNSECFRNCSHSMCLQLLGFTTDELSLRVGQTLAGLLNVTLVSDSSDIDPAQYG